ncbi:putative disease resistance protein RGA4 isoform X2 [Panicum hallii]|uniref:putative disease resistance protein RGA4 isoform X2 n=1 Tax=Panicum hallii TaxID=206008 RepID=UPI000DF4ED80|nr:putative disease resistance protein RGA4 isoform X2 [Panicum hallii]
MAEVLATMVVGPLVSMVKEKASSYLLDQYKVMEGMEEQHEVLKRKLLHILDVIMDAEEQAAAKREGAKAWLEKVRKVTYQANDVLDEFKYEALRRRAKEEGRYKDLGMDVIKLFPTHNRIVFRYMMANKLRMILQEIDDLTKEMNDFRFMLKPGPPEPTNYLRQNNSHIIDPVNIAKESRAREKKDVVDRLLAQASSSDLTVLPIVRMGGLGKTTLAQLIYNDPEIKKHFQLRLWVCVSDNFEVDSLADRILKENGCKPTGCSALEKLQNAVSGKRYLLVLDDVWNRDEHKWERLKSYLQHGGSGSSVLTTTRDEAVAKLMMGKTEGAYKLESLGAYFIEKIIKTRAFSSKEEEWPGELVKMVGQVAKRCAGSPLAATALGSLLRTKTTEEEWKSVLRRSSICDEENKILPVLKLSYNGLPSHLRQCFAFCAMFPKDYEIDVEMLIQLWMANGFILEKQGERPEITGKNIFVELAARSFFQDVKGIPFQFNHTEVSRITCKIHDLMHDVAMDSMGKECANIGKKLSKFEDFPYSARHLYLSVRQPENLLNASVEKGSPAFQTLICDGYVKEDLKILSKYNSIRALKIKRGSFLRPKYLHHLRYLDLSKSDIEALPEDISILYHLQTLDLSYCGDLQRLPKELKYLTSLRHLYTHGCRKLKSMPGGLGHLTSLQTLTCFVAGTDYGCSNVRELQDLDLGGRLELRQLENVTGANGAQAAGLGNKKKLTELELRWTDGDQEAQNNNHEEVVEGLKPHDGLKVLRIYSCGSSTFPTWMDMLNGMVELKLSGCKKLEKLPALWQLPALEFLHLKGLESLHCLCSGATTAVTFQKLKALTLVEMPKFEAWLDTDVVQGGLIFPEVEKLEIDACGSLTALPKAASVITESSGGVDTKCRSAFPALRIMKLFSLNMFDRWEAVEGTPGDGVTFPRLVELGIFSCASLSALPKGGSLLVEQSFGGAETVCRRSAFPALRKLHFLNLSSLEKWGAADGTPGEEVTFPMLVDMTIDKCPKLTYLPEAPKLSELAIQGEGQQISLQAASRCIPSLSSLRLDVSPDDTETTLLHVKQKWDHELPLAAMRLTRCDLLFSSHPDALALWTCFARLVDLTILNCDALVYWPENVFQVLVSLRRLSIWSCSKLTGHTQASDRQSAPERGGLPPRLESLQISGCTSLVEVPNLPASLKILRIGWCGDNIRSIIFGQHEYTELYSGSEATASTAVLKLSSADNHRSLPCLESLSIQSCDRLSEVANLPPSIKTLDIFGCGNLQSLLGKLDVVQKLNITSCRRLESLESCVGELRSLEELRLLHCRSLVSLPDGPQAYSSLRVLQIQDCDGIKLLPRSLRSRLDCLEEKHLDARYEETTWKRAIRTLACSK